MIDGDEAGVQHDPGVRPHRRHRARGTGLVALLLGLVAAPLSTGPAAAAPASCWDTVQSDVDGGGPDVVVGLPSYDLPGKPNAGALVIYSNVAGQGEPDPSSPMRRTLVTADDVGIAPQAGARFGAAVVVWRRLGRPCAELLVGAPGQTVGGDGGAGRAYVLPGAEGGLAAAPREVFDEDVLAGTGGAQAGAGFGSALAADGSTMIAFGAPGRDVGGAADAGRVVRLDRRGAGAAVVSVVQQGGGGAGSPESSDRFGQVLRFAGPGVGPLLLVGVPNEDVGRLADAGAVAMHRPGAPLSMVTQDSDGASGRAEAGDRYGAALATWEAVPVDHPVVMVAVGVPGEDIGDVTDAGMISYAGVDLFETENSVGPIEGRAPTVSQDSPGVPGAVESDDRFGSAVLAGEFGSERLHLVVSAPGENLGSVRDAGMVTLTRVRPESGVPSGSQPWAGWTQDSPDVHGRAETGDAFGAGLAAIQLTEVEQDEDSVWATVLATVPGEDDGSTSNSGMAQLGLPPPTGSVPLIPPIQARAGEAMVGQQMLVG